MDTYRTSSSTGVTPEVALAAELATKISEVEDLLMTGQRNIVVRNRKLHAPIRAHFEALGWIVVLNDDDDHPRLRFRDATEPLPEPVIVKSKQPWWDPKDSIVKSFVYVFVVVVSVLVMAALRAAP